MPVKLGISVISSALGVVIGLCGSTADADLMNGGFQTGDLTGWSATATVEAVNWELSRDLLGQLFHRQSQ